MASRAVIVLFFVSLIVGMNAQNAGAQIDAQAGTGGAGADEPVAGAIEGAVNQAEKVGLEGEDAVQDAAGQAGDKTEGIFNSVKDTAGNAVDKVKGIAGGAVDGVKSAGSSIVHGVESVGGAIKNGAMGFVHMLPGLGEDAAKEAGGAAQNAADAAAAANIQAGAGANAQA
ncbi:hypothetical protein L596_015644 [Steinernema carpocapsae]|uniref:Uncharacterized protein n=1 Tax=Steinernema carpocapsae TaxID=34508 RepID=A0A4U5NGJ7_STECR|nr:hypothetical protein L596_015644 [Steinernema carpocapsae]